MTTIRAKYKNIEWQEVLKIHPESRGFKNNPTGRQLWEAKRGKEFTVKVPHSGTAPCGQPKYIVIEHINSNDHWMCSCIAEIGD